MADTLGASGISILRPVRAGNAFEETIERLLESIKLGFFSSSQKLPPERELAEILGVSRATLRDALRELQDAGYLEVQRGRYGGTFVSSLPVRTTSEPGPLQPADVEDVVLFRRIVESEAAAHAAASDLSAAARQHLLTTLDDVARSTLETYRPKDARLHIAIAELTGSRMLVAAVAEARSRVSDLLDRIPLLTTNIDHSNQQHRDLVDAILGGDAQAAREIAIAHLEGTASLLRGFLS
jgi:DNA-binding FadR family transcriptional regulator